MRIYALLLIAALLLFGCCGQQTPPTITPSPTATAITSSPTPSPSPSPSATPILQPSPTPGECLMKHAATKIMQTGAAGQRVIRGPLVLGIGESIEASEIILTLSDVTSQGGTLTAIYNLSVRGEPKGQVSGAKDARIPLEGTANYYLGVDDITSIPCPTGGLPPEWNATLDSGIERVLISGDSITAVTKTPARDRTVHRFTLSGRKLFGKPVGKCASISAGSSIVAVAGCLDYNTSLSIRMLDGQIGNDLLNKDIRSYYGLLLYWSDTSTPGGLFGPERTYGCTSARADDSSANFTYYYKRNLAADWSNGTLTFDSSGQQIADNDAHHASAPSWADSAFSPCPSSPPANATTTTIGGRTYTADNTPYNVKLRVIENGVEAASLGLAEPITFISAAGGNRLVVASGSTLLVFRLG